MGIVGSTAEKMVKWVKLQEKIISLFFLSIFKAKLWNYENNLVNLSRNGPSFAFCSAENYISVTKEEIAVLLFYCTLRDEATPLPPP